MPVLEPQRRPAKLRERGGDPLVRALPISSRAGRTVRLRLDALDEPVEVRFPLDLLGLTDRVIEPGQHGGTLPPELERWFEKFDQAPLFQS